MPASSIICCPTRVGYPDPCGGETQSIEAKETMTEASVLIAVQDRWLHAACFVGVGGKLTGPPGVAPVLPALPVVEFPLAVPPRGTWLCPQSKCLLVGQCPSHVGTRRTIWAWICVRCTACCNKYRSSQKLMRMGSIK